MEQFKMLALAACVILIALPIKANGLQVRVSAYAAVPSCTKPTNPRTCASEHHITSKDCYHLIALCPKLARHYQYGDVFILKVGKRRYWVKYEDRMSSRIRGPRSVDFLLPSIGACKKFGVKKAILTPINRMR